MAAHAEVAQGVLDRISRVLGETQRLLNENHNLLEARRRLTEAQANLHRVSLEIDGNRFNIIRTAIDQLLSITERRIADQAQGSQSLDPSPDPDLPENGAETGEQPFAEQTQRGRPKVKIQLDQLQHLYKEGYSAKRMAQHFKCSTTLIYKHLYNHGMKMRHRYTDISDEQLKEVVRELNERHPNSGLEMMCGYLRSRGLVIQRKRVRAVLQAADPVGAAARWGRTVARRTYHVQAPNSLWHIDGHMKLIRWGLVTHGAVDGYSRMVVYLKCSTSNRAEVVQELFFQASKKYGLPSRVRSDYGSENTDVALFMNLVRGFERGSHITGQSTHNQRIERLWGDVHKDVTSTFYNELYKLEDDGLLHIDDPTHMFAVHYVYLDEINEHLEQFREGWNNHRVRTEHNRTPRQIWLDGFLQNANSQATSVTELFQEEQSMPERLHSLLNGLGTGLGRNDDQQSSNLNLPGARNIPSGITLNENQFQYLEDNVSNTPGRRADKFKTCINSLSEILQ